MKNQTWKYKIRSSKTPVILTFIMFAVFGGLTAWLYSNNNGAFIFLGLFSAILLALVIATAYRLAFYKVLIGKDGFYYQTGPKDGKFYNYADVKKAWVNSGEAQNRAGKRSLRFLGRYFGETNLFRDRYRDQSRFQRIQPMCFQIPARIRHDDYLHLR